MNSLVFNSTHFDVIEYQQKLWLTATELAHALGYSKSDAVTQIYERNCDEFSSEMTETLNLSVSGNLQKTVRIFSLRGAHLVAMFSRTKVAKQFRKWVLDVLEKESSQPIAILPPQSAPQLPNHTYPNFYDSGWIPAHYQRCQSETHWTYHIKFNVRPRGGKFSATFELGIGGKGQAQPNFSSSGSQFVDSNFYLEYRDLNELWEYIAKVLAKYGARCPF
ncbi:Bro-N domain-containing protein [Vibrio artabrorum]|uniref:BRO-N domain-containing protein n=1 Tax=Vibrio artabrorum TaxID=446374 RepID=UPI00354E8D56